MGNHDFIESIIDSSDSGSEYTPSTQREPVAKHCYRPILSCEKDANPKLWIWDIAPGKYVFSTQGNLLNKCCVMRT